MSRREHEFDELETRLRAEAPTGGGLSDFARAQLRERLACTAPEPGAAVMVIGGRMKMLAAAAMLAVAVGAVVMTQSGTAPAEAPEEEARVVEAPIGAQLRDQLRGMAAGVVRETPLLEEARRMAADVNALRSVFRERATVLGWKPRTEDG